MEIQTHTLLQAAVDWLATFVQPSLWIELLTLASALVLAWFVTAGLRRLFTQGDDDPNSILFGRRLFDGVLFPLALLGLAYAGRSMLLYWGLPLGVFRVVIPALLSLAAIRTGVKVLQVAMDDAPWVRAVERTISWLAWGAALLWITGVLPLVLHEFRPNLLANYLFETANAFHTFYEACPVLKSEEPVRSSRLALCELTGRILATGLGLLGIRCPERM
jgi:hypothetical protein